METSPIFVFRMTFYVNRGSSQARVYPRRRRWLSLNSRAKSFTLQGRHRRFVGDSACHTSLRGAPLLFFGEQQKWCHQILQKVQNLMPHDCVCVCVFSSHSFLTSSSLDVPAGVTQEEGNTGFLIHLLFAVRALIFSREGFSHSFPSSTVKSKFVY